MLDTTGGIIHHRNILIIFNSGAFQEGRIKNGINQRDNDQRRL